ncbi:MAG: nitrous oxide reductase accessory protein NosL [Pseudomonadota bacterium]
MRLQTLLNCLLAAGLLLAACGDSEQQAAKPAPQELTREAIGYYCNMIVADHHGPKAQLFLRGTAEPIWFSSVRDAVAFTMLPDEPKAIAAIYVNDMGRATWATPEAGTWIEATGAHYVIHSDRRGGMGAREAVPFAARADAEDFVAARGGHIVAFTELPEDYILSAEPESAHHGAQEATHTEEMTHDHQD